MLLSKALAGFLAVLVVSPASAADPPGIRLPEEQPESLPPKAVTKLKAGEVYALDSDTPVVVVVSPEGLVSVTEETGPAKINAVFAGNTKRTWRTYKGQQVFTLEAVQSGTVELLVIPVGSKRSSDVLRRVIQVEAGDGPRPPPDDGKPKPPVVGKLFGFVLIEETSQAWPTRGEAIAAASKWADANGVKRRVADKDVKDAAGNTPADIAPYIARAAGKTLPRLTLITETGGILWEGDCPKAGAELTALLGRYK